MSRFGRVPPSAGSDVTDRKACFLSLLAQAAVWLLELGVSRTFLDKLRPQLLRSWILSSARDIDGGPQGSWGVEREAWSVRGKWSWDEVGQG